MYTLSSQLHNLPIISLQTGLTVATVARPIINPDRLELVGVLCQLQGERRRDHKPGQSAQVLLVKDIRQIGTTNIAIDSAEEIGDSNEIVRLQPLVAKPFNPIGALVLSESGQRLGRVEEYTVNLTTYCLQKLYVKQPLLKSLLVDSLVVDRTQIIDVKPGHITVRDATVKEPLLRANPIIEK